MGKQKRNYNMARIRPTSYSHVYTNQQFDRHDSKTQRVYSNLLHHYERVGNRQQQRPKITVLQLQKGNSGKIKAIDVQMKGLQRKLPFQSHFLTQRSSCISERQRLSNYSLYLQRSMSKQSRRSSQRVISFSRAPIEVCRSELLQPCKITPMKISTRRIESNIIKDNKESAEIIRRRNKSGRSKMASQINVSKRLGQEQIEPWKMKNYESIMI